MAVTFQKLVLPHIGADLHKQIQKIETQFFEEDPLKAIESLKTDVIQKEGTAPFAKHYAQLRQARAHLRMGSFKEAHLIIEELLPILKAAAFPPAEKDSKAKIDEHTALYLEWALMAKKVYWKQFFQEKALQLMKDTLKACEDWGKADTENSYLLDGYRCKLYENLTMIYIETFYYQVAKENMQQSEKLREADTEGKVFSQLDALKFQLKQANFQKKAGFYFRSLGLFEKLVADIDKVECDSLKYRIKRDYGRLLAIVNRQDESKANFDDSLAYLKGDLKKNLKAIKVNYLQGLAARRISTDLAINHLEKALLLYSEAAGSTDNYFVTQCFFEIGQINAKQQKFNEAMTQYKEAAKFLTTYFKDPIYGSSSSENHPLMQQYYLLTFEWAGQAQNREVEETMLKKYLELIEMNNKAEGRKSIFLIEPRFQAIQNSYYIPAKKMKSAQLKQEIQDLDVIQMENGLIESQQYINWAKLFYAVTLFSEGQTYKAVDEMETVVRDYCKSLDGDETHPFIENFYSQLGNMAYKNKQSEKAKDVFKKLIKSKKAMYGDQGKEVIAPLMQLQFLHQTSNEFGDCKTVSFELLTILDKVIGEMDTKLVVQAGSFSPQEKEKLEKDLQNHYKFKIEALFSIQNLFKMEKKFGEALEYAKKHTEANLQVFSRTHRAHAYALFCELQCTTKMPEFDQNESLRIANEALKIQQKVSLEENKPDALLGRIYEEKGHIYSMLAMSSPDMKLELRAQALRSFNSCMIILETAQDEGYRMKAVAEIIQGMEKDPELVAAVTASGAQPIDTEFLTDKERFQLFGEIEGEKEDEGSSGQGALLAGIGLAVVGIASYFVFKKR